MVGEQLSAVVFVMDYLQLQFNGKGFTLLTPVSVRSPTNVIHQGEPGWRDALCAQITQIVQNVNKKDEDLSINFSNGYSICASLRIKDFTGPEAVIFNDGDFICVMRIDDV